MTTSLSKFDLDLQLANLERAKKLNYKKLRCHKCGWQRGVTLENAATYLRYGWPEHCGRVMEAEC